MSSEIEVDMGEMEKTENPDILFAGFGPCIVIGFYNPKTKSGYMIHDPHIQTINLSAKIDLIKKDYGDLSKLKVFVTGNSFFRDPGEPIREARVRKELEKRDRLYIEAILKKYFKTSQIKYEWLPDEYEATLSLHTDTGRFELESEPRKRF